jgi:GTP-binding protein LepA
MSASYIAEPMVCIVDEQKEGKKRLKTVGMVEIPQEAFMSILDPGED